MNRFVQKVVLGAVAVCGLGGAAQASSLDITVRIGGQAWDREVDVDDGERFERRRHRVVEEPRYERPEPGRYYGRPVPDGPHWGRPEPGRYYGRPVPDGPHWGRPEPGRYYGRPVPDVPHWTRPVRARPDWGQGYGCRVIVKQRVNRWGDLVERRIRICD